MKSPREILLSPHRRMTGRLDALRRAVVAEHVVSATATPDPRPSSRFSSVVQELFLGNWRAWLSLASAWVVILALHLAARIEGPALRHEAPAWSPQETALLQDQLELRRELLGMPTPASASAAPAITIPHSEHRPRLRPV